MDFRERGPSFRASHPAGDVRPIAADARAAAGFVGGARRIGEPLHRAASAAPLRAPGGRDRCWRAQQVVSPRAARSRNAALTKALAVDGLRTFALTLHSPSLKPGCTCYVRDTAERDAFLATIDRYCDFFFSDLGGVPTTAEELFDDLVGTRNAGAPERRNPPNQRPA
jgi:hypothetical protein